MGQKTGLFLKFLTGPVFDPPCIFVTLNDCSR